MKVKNFGNLFDFYYISSIVSVHVYAKIYSSWSNCFGITTKQKNIPNV